MSILILPGVESGAVYFWVRCLLRGLTPTLARVSSCASPRFWCLVIQQFTTRVGGGVHPIWPNCVFWKLCLRKIVYLDMHTYRSSLLPWPEVIFVFLSFSREDLDDGGTLFLKMPNPGGIGLGPIFNSDAKIFLASFANDDLVVPSALCLRV